MTKYTVKQIGPVRLKKAVSIPDLSQDDAQELIDILEQEVLKLEKIQKAKDLLESQNWHKVNVNWNMAIDLEWCNRAIKGACETFEDCWYFENEKDAHLFLLKYGEIP